MKIAGRFFGLLLLMQCLCNTVSASLDTAFIKYLATNTKIVELNYYLKTNCSNDATGHYQWAKYYLFKQQDSAFMHHYNNAKQLFLQDTVATGFATCYFLQHAVNNTYADAWFAQLQNYPAYGVQQVIAIYNLQFAQSKKIVPAQYPNLLNEAVTRYKKSASKNPTKAAILSAIVPGSGNLYTGQQQIATQTFASTILFAASATESVVKTKATSALSIFTLFLGSLFYGSNVYGAYRDAKYFKQEHLQQLYLDAYNYYSTAYYPALY
jgi:hypothetical protein